MAPVLRTKKPTGGYRRAVVGRRSTSSSLAAHASTKGLVAEKEVEASQEQALASVGRKQEVHEAKPDHPIAFPLDLSGDVDVAKVEVTAKEKKRVLEALCLILLASCDLELSELGGLPGSLDIGHDIVWDWRSVELSANEYGAFAHAVVSSRLKYDLDVVSYDWTPIDSHRGTLSVRKKCGFQSRLTRMLSDVISDAIFHNNILATLAERKGLEHQKLASVLTGTVEGVRTPCRCWSYIPLTAEWTESQQDGRVEPQPYIGVEDFVLEVGMGEKTPLLGMLARSYIERGTLCVMTVKLERQGRYDFGWSYSLYRRGKAISSPGRITRYKVVCAAQDKRVKVNRDGMVEFPVGLTLFDLMPSSVLKKHGVTCKNDNRAVLELTMSSEKLAETEAQLGWSLGEGVSISQHLENLSEIL